MDNKQALSQFEEAISQAIDDLIESWGGNVEEIPGALSQMWFGTDLIGWIETAVEDYIDEAEHIDDILVDQRKGYRGK